MQWSLEKIYREQVNGNIPPRKHLKVSNQDLIDEQQKELFKTLKGGPRKGEMVPMPEKEKDLEKHEVTDSKKLKISNEDIQLFDVLDYADQIKVKKYIETKALKGIIQDTFKGKEADVKDALRLLMSGDLSSDQITNVVQLVNQDKAINVEGLKAPGNKPWNKIFLHEDVWEAYKDLIGVGVGKEQKGPGEVALTFLSPRVNLSTKGDIDIDGELYELKLNGGRISDQAAPSQKEIQPILDKYIGNYGRPAQGNKTMSLVELVDRINQHKKNEGKDSNYYASLAKELFSKMLDEKHAAPFAQLFAKDVISPDEAIDLYKKQSFDWYKESKKGTNGEWDKLIGINYKKSSKGAVSTIVTGDQFAKSPMVRPQIRILRSSSGTREGYPDYYPTV